MRVTLASIGFATYAALVSADSCAQQPAGSDPTAGILSITAPNTAKPVTAGSTSIITWQKLASTADTVSIVLCKGPSTNCVPIACVTGSASNDAPNNTPEDLQSFAWNVPSDLTASGSSGGYGLKIIENGSGRFQYSTQFGVLNSNVVSTSEAPVQQTTDGQVQQPTSSAILVSTSAFPTYTISSPSEVATNVPFPIGTAGSSGYGIAAPTGKTSNTTHSSGYKFSYAPNVATAGVFPIPSPYYQVPTSSGTVPASLLPIASGAPGSPSSGGVPAQSSIVPATGAARKTVAGGFLAGLGAAAALLL